MLDSINQDILNEQIQGMNFFNLPGLEILDQNFYIGNNVDQQENDDTAKSVKQERNIVQLKLKLEMF